MTSKGWGHAHVTSKGWGHAHVTSKGWGHAHVTSKGWGHGHVTCSCDPGTRGPHSIKIMYLKIIADGAVVPTGLEQAGGWFWNI